MPNEYNLIDKAIFQLLSGDATIQQLVGLNPTSAVVQVYWRKAPMDAKFPCVIYSLYRNKDLNGSGGYRVMVKGQYLVFAVDQNVSTVNIRPIADRIDDLMRMNQMENDPIIMGIERDSVYEYGPIEEQGNQFVGIGGIYNFAGYQQVNPAENIV